jgi:hypothetical protein
VEAVSDATLPEDANIERIIASASCEAGTAEAQAEDWGGGAEGASDASAASPASPWLAAGPCDPRSKLIRLLKPAGDEAVRAGVANRVEPGIFMLAGKFMLAGRPMLAGKGGCAFLATATAFTPVANAVPAPKRRDLNSSD